MWRNNNNHVPIAASGRKNSNFVTEICGNDAKDRVAVNVFQIIGFYNK